MSNEKFEFSQAFIDQTLNDPELLDLILKLKFQETYEGGMVVDQLNELIEALKVKTNL